MIFGRTTAQRKEDKMQSLADKDGAWTHRFAYLPTLMDNGQIVWLSKYWKYTRVRWAGRLMDVDAYVETSRYINKKTLDR